MDRWRPWIGRPANRVTDSDNSAMSALSEYLLHVPNVTIDDLRITDLELRAQNARPARSLAQRNASGSLQEIAAGDPAARRCEPWRHETAED